MKGPQASPREQRITLAVIAFALLFAPLLTGCDSDPSGGNTDPRKGRVTITDSDCATGSCIYDWKICIGGDLLMYVNNTEHWIRPSAECAS